MIELRDFDLSDKQWIDELVRLEDSQNAEYNFGNMYLWGQHYKRQVCRMDNRLAARMNFGSVRDFVFPIGEGSIRPAIDAYTEIARAENRRLKIFCLNEKNMALLESEYPGRFEYKEIVDAADYIYSAQKLSTYAGRSLHVKKNHCNRFEAENEWHFEELTPALLPECERMLETWAEDNAERLDSSVHIEYSILNRVFREYEQLGFEGGVLYANGQIVGFTMAERANSDTYDIHFEKAVATMNGAYPMTCREFVRMLIAKHPEVKHINREDDLGLESLRRSKQSYKPEYMLRKFRAKEIIR